MRIAAEVRQSHLRRFSKLNNRGKHVIIKIQNNVKFLESLGFLRGGKYVSGKNIVAITF